MGRHFSPRKTAINLGLPLLLIALLVILFTGKKTVVEKNQTNLASSAPAAVTLEASTAMDDPAKAFNDSNYIHLDEAKVIGIEPLTDTRSCWQLRRPIVKIESCREYLVDELTHSRPYLVPEAANALKEIGHRFQKEAGEDYRIKVTSVLRTPESLARLRRHNSNASDSSAHRYATTFDISYSRFDSPEGQIPSRELEDHLANVLLQMRREGKLWIKKERHQPCFHITARAI